MITIKDISSHLGVSPSTVTRALADSPRISAKTRQLVRETAANMGYVPNTAAKTMRNQSSRLIGLLIPDIENSFYARIAKAFSEVCNHQDFQLMLAVSDDNADVEERLVRQLVSARCEGIAIVPSANLTAMSAKLLSAYNCAQLIRQHVDLQLDWFGVNDEEALRNAVNHLIDLKHQRIGLICGDEDLNSARDRYRGYCVAHQQNGLQIDEDLVIRGAPRVKFAQQAIHRFKSMQYPPTAIISAGAGITEGMLNGISEWSADRMQAVSLIGYSDTNFCKWWGGSGLTTIDLPVHQIAADLCLMLIQRARGGKDMDKPSDYVYNSELILRGSVHPKI